MGQRFEGKVIMITGATSGLGKHAAVAFASEGAHVVAAGRRQEEGEKTVAEIEAAGGAAVFVEADVSVSEDVERIVAAARDRFGGLDWAYNVAGVPGDALLDRFAEATEQFFADPAAARDESPARYEGLAAFFRQDPIARAPTR